MIPLMLLCFSVLWSECHSNFTQNNVDMDLTQDTSEQLRCRSETREYLTLDRFRADTCARCYRYMPENAFKTKLRYISRWSLLYDPRTNLTYEANSVNLSTEVEQSFAKQYFLLKWKECCLAAASCCDRMLAMPKNDTGASFCPRTWDGWQCWDDTPGGTTASGECQGHIYHGNDAPSCSKYAYKECWPNGTWYHDEYFREWTNYTKCSRLEEQSRQLYFHIVAYSISIVSLVPALIIFSIYKQLQVPRVSLHKNLFASLFLKGVSVVLFEAVVIVDELNKSPDYATIMDGHGHACKILSILFRYFAISNYTWMFCEGFYLHKLIAAAFAEQKSLLLFYIIGWVSPVVPVGIYAILRETIENEKCWALPADDYEWILYSPNLACLLVNAFFLCNIIRVLVTKLRATHSNEPSQYRKAVRATFILVPLFGLQFCLIIYRPPPSTACGLRQAYTYFSQAIEGLQGLLVSLIFCYMNGEILHLLWRSLDKFRTIRQLPPPSHKRHYSGGTVSLSSMRHRRVLD